MDSALQEGVIVFDIIFYVRLKDGLSQIIINVEVQKDDPSEYHILNRAIFYTSRMVSSQKDRDFARQKFNDLKRVYSIWVCMNMKECIWNYIHLQNDAIMADYDWKGKLDLLNIVLLGVPNELPEQGEKYHLHRLLAALFAVNENLNLNKRLDILENEYHVAAGSDFGKELNDMCNLGQGILELGIEQGIERGIEQGKMEYLMGMLKAGIDIPAIMAVTGMTESEVISLKDSIKGEKLV